MANSPIRRSVITLAVFLTVVVIPALPALADTLVYQALIPQQYTNWNQFAIVPQFDPSVGTLNFVVVRLTSSFQASILAQNWAPTPGNITASLVSSVTLAPPSPLPLLGTTAEIPSSTQPVAAYTGGPPGGPDTAIWNLGPTHISVEETFTAADLIPFIGTGPVQFGLAGAAESWIFSDTGNVLVMVASQSGAQVDVEYHYTVIPEPATIVLLLLGFAALRRGRPS